MRYICEVTINRTRDEVLDLFDDTNNLYKWQKTLKKVEIIEGNKYENGLRSRFTYDNKGKDMVMIEIVEKFDYPDQMIAIYEAPNVWNRCVNDLIEKGNKTIWRIDSEFKCKGFMRVVTLIGKKMFINQTMKDLNNFKRFAEEGHI